MSSHHMLLQIPNLGVWEELVQQSNFTVSILWGASVSSTGTNTGLGQGRWGQATLSQGILSPCGFAAAWNTSPHFPALQTPNQEVFCLAPQHTWEVPCPCAPLHETLKPEPAALTTLPIGRAHILPAGWNC